MSAKTKDSASSSKKAVFILFALLLCAGVAFLTVKYLHKDDAVPKRDLSQLRLKDDIISFTYRMVPGLYTGLARLNDELLLIDKEIARFKELETEFPQQKKIVQSERTQWEKTQKELISSAASVEKNVEMLYVSYIVNPEDGKGLIQTKSDDLIKSIDDALDATGKFTGRLKIKIEKTLMEKIKELF